VLVDLSDADIALTHNHRKGEYPFIFAESYERIGEGLFYTNWMFEDLGKSMILTDEPFNQLTRKFFDKLREHEKEIGEDAAFNSGYSKKLRADYHSAREFQERNFPSDYGVCDYPAQVAEKYPALLTDARRFVITFGHVEKDATNKGNGGGWRWHKWGDYIGDKSPQWEYLDDEDESITEVYTFQILQLHDSPEDIERGESPFIDDEED